MKNLLYGATLILLFFASVAAVVAILLNKEKADEDALLKGESGSVMALSNSIEQCRVTFGVNSGRLAVISSVKIPETSSGSRASTHKEVSELTLFARILDESGREMLKVPLKSEEAQILTQPGIELKALPPKLSFSLVIPNLPRSYELELFYMQGPTGLKSLGRFLLPVPE